MALPRDAVSEGTPTILIVDDNEMDLELMRRALLPLDFPLLTARNAREAYSTLTEHRVCAVVCDQNMPNTSGVTLMSGVRTLYPRVIRILMSGAGTEDTLTEGVNAAGIHRYLKKDWPPERLRAEVREVLRDRAGQAAPPET
jgi:two-component system response regulator HupR/HoxA